MPVATRMKRKHQRTFELIFCRPVSGNVQRRDVEAQFVELGAEVSEREGSRAAIVLFEEVRVFRRPHPSPVTDKGAVARMPNVLGHVAHPSMACGVADLHQQDRQ